jgi:hypothetical protein
MVRGKGDKEQACDTCAGELQRDLLCPGAKTDSFVRSLFSKFKEMMNCLVIQFLS